MAVGNDVGVAALPSSSELALERMLLTHDRARMALVWTATSLIGLLLLATIRGLRLRKKLKRIYPEAGFSLATIMAAFISLLGIPALIAVILRQ